MAEVTMRVIFTVQTDGEGNFNHENDVNIWGVTLLESRGEPNAEDIVVERIEDYLLRKTGWQHR